MPVTRVRDARIEDAPEIARIHVGMWRHAYREYLPLSFLNGLSIEARRRGWSAQLIAPRDRTATLVADRDGEIVGFCSLGPCRDDDGTFTSGELYAIYVGPDRARTGIGSALMTAALRRLSTLRFREARLWVLTENAPARAFYEHHGWCLDGAIKAEPIPGGELRESRYTRSLDDPGATPPSSGNPA